MSIQILDEKLIQQIERLAQQERRQQVEIIARALYIYEKRLEATASSPFLLAIAGLGSSGQGDVAEHDEEILATEIDPRRGWGLKRDAL
jgi:predicted transcriptional regulator